ncbi:ATP-dependent DNA helicase Hel308 [Candidatus Bilamarchaeum dharawalense]|uniref:ATP-dependent DNA helicase Hel308 n=1 Tax=Candidatus Bilamarchaeum dharawalense TaxID=2885759 RepID=A0A5E4LRJ5_9ARCH|nr:ATP-dependent DNA helicase Hel308 [Candidatus Bilamarchaeum dharawalense]
MPSVADLVRERFGELTPIQKIAMPNVLAGQNVLILAPTGSGKTESALLPILEKIKKPLAGDGKGIRALYITPLRALSRDLKQRFNWWCDRLEISHDIRTGDTTLAERAKHRQNPPQILLTTVESLQALLLGRVMRKHLSTIEFVIVDEIHDILDNKRGAQLSLGLERLNEIAKFQRIGISATVANESEAAKLLFGERPFQICESGKNRQMDFSVEELSNEKRLERIKDLSEKFRSLIFVNTRSTAEEIGASLKKLNAPLGIHHGSLAKEVRQITEDDFKSGKINSILCTSSLELGIDVGDVSLVLQYGSPHQVFRLIQRVGRSGHSLEKTPKGIIFCSDFDDRLESEVITVFAKNGWMEDKKSEVGALDVIAHQVIGLCLDFGRLELSQIHSILSRSYAYNISFDKLRMIALQLYGEGLIYYDETPKDVLIKAKPRARIYYSDFLSTIPKTKKFLLRDISSNRFISSLDEEFVVNLESGSSFLSHGLAWRVIDITEKEVLAEPTSGLDIMIPSWTGEDIPVSFEVAQEVGRMRSIKKETSPLPDDKTVVIEIVEDLIVIHACFGTKINEAISRVFSKQLTSLIGESVIAVSDPYRILVKLPFPMKEEYVKRAFENVRNIQNQLTDALEHSSLLKFKFLHVARMFGLLSVEGTLNSRYIQVLRHSVIYEETIRSIFFRYFDVEKTEEILGKIRNKQIQVIYDLRKKPSYFAQIGLERVSGAESIGAFEPRERILSAFKENALSKTVRLVCLHCKATRFMHLASAPEKIKCHNCNQSAFALVSKEGEAHHDLEFSAGLIRAYGKQALIALSTYGIGPSTADRVLRRLHKTEEAFFLDLIEAQKNFIKNKKYWKLH